MSASTLERHGDRQDRNRTAAPADFSRTQKAVHWIMAFLIISMLIAGQFFNDPDKLLADRLWSREQHGSGGVVIGLLLLVRLFMRLWRGVPQENGATTPSWQSIMAQLSHWGMYVVMAGLVISGLAVGMFATYPLHLPILGGFNLAIMGNASEELFQQVRWYHALMSDIAIGFVLLHILAAFYHLFWIRDRVMQRMFSVWQSEGHSEEEPSGGYLAGSEDREARS